MKSTVHYAGNDGVVVRLTFKTTADAQGAVNKFHGLPADGRKLKVTIIGSANATLSGRLGGVSNGTVDDLMDEDPDAGSSCVFLISLYTMLRTHAFGGAGKCARTTCCVWTHAHRC